MLCNRCTGIYKFGNNTYPRRIRCRSNLGHIFQGKKVRLMGREIRYMYSKEQLFSLTQEKEFDLEKEVMIPNLRAIHTKKERN